VVVSGVLSDLLMHVAHKSVGQQFHLPFDRFGDRNPHGAQRGPRTETIESHNENEKSCNIRY
jgi:hypothetical protein